MGEEAKTGQGAGPMRWGVVAVALLVGVAAGGVAVFVATRNSGPGPAVDAGVVAAVAKKVRYQCPMDPQIIRDEPGSCPICGMKLVRVEEAPKAEHKVVFYRSPMDPNMTSPTPAKDSMGMDYVPVFDDETQGTGGLKGLATVSIDFARQQLIGLHTVAVTQGPVGGSWRTVGRIGVDETRVRHVNVKVDGFVERLYVDFIGKPVKKGQPLFSLYSPELLSVQNEYLLALKTQKALAAGGSLNSSGDTLVAAAKQRLANWDIPQSAIDQLEKTEVPQRTLTLVSPISGVVSEKSIVEGARLNAGDMPFSITDLGQVWVLADVYESDLSRIHLDMKATLTLQALPNRSFEGKVSFIDPVLDPKTRTAKVRMEFANPQGELRPDLFGEVVFQSAGRTGLSLPTDAVIDSGTRKVVFVALGEGKFEPRLIEVGATAGDRVEVVKGLTAGEEVVTRANFLMDSESRLKAIIQTVEGKP